MAMGGILVRPFEARRNAGPGHETPPTLLVARFGWHAAGFERRAARSERCAACFDRRAVFKHLARRPVRAKVGPMCLVCRPHGLTHRALRLGPSCRFAPCAAHNG